jgi:hypothetical protein
VWIAQFSKARLLSKKESRPFEGGINGGLMIIA